MRIKHDEMIAGQPALVMRKLMKIGQSSSINLDDVIRICQVSQDVARTTIGELLAKGCIAAKKKPDAWDSTELGNALSMASLIENKPRKK